MKFNCGESFQERFDRENKWHKWWAWRPVRVGSHDCRWREYVLRKKDLRIYMGEIFDFGTEYKATDE